MNAWFLSKEDRIKAVERVRHNMTGIKNNEWKKAQVIEALLDPKTWFIVVLALAVNIPNGGISTVCLVAPAVPHAETIPRSSRQSSSTASVSLC